MKKITLLIFFISLHSFATNDFRTSLRKKIMGESLDQIKSESLRSDDVGTLLRGYSVSRNLNDIAIDSLKEKQLSTKPWSDDYWPIYKGGTAARYAVQDYQFIGEWREANQYVLANTAQSIFLSGDIEEINKLSPAEKYDLLISNKSYLAQSNWSQGQRYSERSSDGSIETWMGICHGWAPASYMVERPKNAIKVMGYDNKTLITFYPADLKALASQLWATGDYQNNFIGGRCRSENPAENSDGRTIDQSCLDNNPASFHLALINSVGIHNKSFVMDVTYDYEVWNQPVSGYRYHFLDFRTKKRILNWREAIVKLADVEDPYKKYRSSKAVYALAIAMEVDYGVETRPEQLLYETAEQDSYNKLYVKYDLEMDANYKIIGGEWYQRSHPDFLWTPQVNSYAMAPGDYYLLSNPLWKGEKALASNIKELAKDSAVKRLPLSYIVKSLIQKSVNEEI